MNKKRLKFLILFADDAKNYGKHYLANLAFAEMLEICFNQISKNHGWASLEWETAAGSSTKFDLITVVCDDLRMCIPLPLLNKDTALRAIKKAKRIGRLEHSRVVKDGTVQQLNNLQKDFKGLRLEFVEKYLEPTEVPQIMEKANKFQSENFEGLTLGELLKSLKGKDLEIWFTAFGSPMYTYTANHVSDFGTVGISGLSAPYLKLDGSMLLDENAEVSESWTIFNFKLREQGKIFIREVIRKPIEVSLKKPVYAAYSREDSVLFNA